MDVWAASCVLLPLSCFRLLRVPCTCLLGDGTIQEGQSSTACGIVADEVTEFRYGVMAILLTKEYCAPGLFIIGGNVRVASTPADICRCASWAAEICPC